MYIKGDQGGYCCPPNLSRHALMCNCGHWQSHYLSAHEIAHWMIKYVMYPMAQEGKLELPEFINNTDWSYTAPHDGPYPAGQNCTKKKENSEKYGKLHDFLWNSMRQDRIQNNTVMSCSNDHYFIYTGQDKYLSFGFGGAKPLEKSPILTRTNESRASMEQRNPNLLNLLDIIWPCNNIYIPDCEDSAYNFTKGLNQQLFIGRSNNASNPNTMTCTQEEPTNIDIQDLSPMPEEDNTEFATPKVEKWAKVKCWKIAKKGGWLGKGDKLGKLKIGEVAQNLVLGDESAWWLRKCCPISAKFFAKGEIFSLYVIQIARVVYDILLTR